MTWEESVPTAKKDSASKVYSYKLIVDYLQYLDLREIQHVRK